MTARHTSLAIITVVLVFVAGLAVVTLATEKEPVTNSGRVPLPVIPQAQGDGCVEDTDFIRRNHMALLKHKRDETTRKGIRTKQDSLKECVDCHAVLGPDEIPVTADSPEYFCSSCHEYAAVKIDCFQCHSSKPEPGVQPADHQPGSVLRNSLGPHGIECK